MLEHGYLSHWDTKGQKPYMRYTLAGGTGKVTENIGLYKTEGFVDVEKAINKIVTYMLYNDSKYYWSHRDNILGPLHNKVSIGVSYDATNVFLVLDFEDQYLTRFNTDIKVNKIVLEGKFMDKKIKLKKILIYYDPLPQQLIVNQLEKPLYNGPYDKGNFIASVLPEKYVNPKVKTIIPSMWIQQGELFKVDIASENVLEKNGVYTFYISDGEDMYMLVTQCFIL